MLLPTEQPMMKLFILMHKCSPSDHKSSWTEITERLKEIQEKVGMRPAHSKEGPSCKNCEAQLTVNHLLDYIMSWIS